MDITDIPFLQVVILYIIVMTNFLISITKGFRMYQAEERRKDLIYFINTNDEENDKFAEYMGQISSVLNKNNIKLPEEDDS